MKIITTEEHLVNPYYSGPQPKVVDVAPYYGLVIQPGLPYFPVANIAATAIEERVRNMDETGISMQILSLTTEMATLDKDAAVAYSRSANDTMSEIMKKYPDRFSAFACLPWAYPEEAAEELERAVNHLGINGAMICGRPVVEAEFLDNPRYDPILKVANDHEIPIYVHPGTPAPAVQQAYYAGFNDVLSARLSVFGYGWHTEAGIHVLRMILGGVFEKFPKLQIISGHWGEFVPGFLFRLDQALPQIVTGLSKSITDTYKEHVYIGPSGILDYPNLRFAIDVMGEDRIVYSVDFPLISNVGAAEWLENAPISEEAKEKIAYKNIAKLMKL